MNICEFCIKEPTCSKEIEEIEVNDDGEIEFCPERDDGERDRMDG